MYQRKVTDLQEPTPQAAQHKHLRTGLVALAVFLALAVAGRSLLGLWESRYLDALAPMAEDEVVKGISTTREAARREDLLVLLGSSELTFQDEFHPAKLFANQPTGFSVHIVGSGYRQSIHNVMTLAALGPAVKGKPLVLFISPSWFTKTIAENAYKKNFSPVQVYEFVYTSPLSPALKQRAVRRLLALGSPGTDDPILRATLEAMTDKSLWGRVRYCAVWPLGRMRLETLRLKDEVDVAKLVIARRLQPLAQTARRSQEPEWDQLLAKAEAEARDHTTNNVFGIHNNYYAKYVGPRLDQLRNSAVGESWLNSSEYADLELVLATLKDLDVKPLFVSLPVMGRYYDFKAHPAADRRAYYARVHGAIERAGFPIVDFGDREYEMGFMRDPWHPGWKGSVQIAQALDQFYHGRVPGPPH